VTEILKPSDNESMVSAEERVSTPIRGLIAMFRRRLGGKELKINVNILPIT
jgi:hypothetical protein